MKKWEIIHQGKDKKEKITTENIIKILLENRGLPDEKEIEEFLHPTLERVTIDNVGIDNEQLQKSLQRIDIAIDKKEQIIVFGDYDVDGICGAAILWETLRDVGANSLPYIPHRVDEGYGLSVKALQTEELLKRKPRLIITVDNGIVANEAVDYANKEGIDVIITDHHVMPSEEAIPKAFSIVHTTKLCGTGVAYMLSKEILKRNKKEIKSDHLALVALATVADLVPLKGANRTLLYHGLKLLRITNRLGLLKLLEEAAINKEDIDPYTIGHVIAPRLNAAGRLEYAMDALRLLCTKNEERATDLAMKLGQTNKERQQLTIESVQHAKDLIKTNKWEENKLFFVSHEIYEQGIIGLIAGRITEEYYRPAIVLSKGEKYSKASARSIRGFDLIAFIRTVEEHLVNAGGHPMAAGFTVENIKLEMVQKLLEEKAQELLTEDMLIRSLRIDCELDLSIISQDFYYAIQQLSPFGMGNMEPIFVSHGVKVEDMRIIGKDGKHLKFKTVQGLAHFDAIGFGLAEKSGEIHNGDSVDIVYTVDENEWNGQKKLQLKIKDIKL